MNHRSIYNPDTGEILRQVSASERQIERQTREGEAHIDGHYDSATYWVDGGSPVARPQFRPESPRTALAVNEEAPLAPLPAGTSVSIDGQHTADMDDSGQLDLSFDSVGRHRVHLSLWPYQPKELTFEVQAPD